MAANLDTTENSQFAQTAFAQFNLSIQDNHGKPTYVIWHNDNGVITALSQKLATDFNIMAAPGPNGNAVITLNNSDIKKMRGCVGRSNRVLSDGEWTGNFNPPPYQINIADLMRTSPQPTVNRINPQPQQYSAPVHSPIEPANTIYFSPGEVKNIFQKLNTNPVLRQQFLTGDGKSYEDTLALQFLPDKSLYTRQQLTNLHFAIQLLYGINVVVNAVNPEGYNLRGNTPAEQAKLQQIKMGGNQSQNPNVFLAAPQASSSSSAPQPQSSYPAQQIIRRGIGSPQ